MDVQGRAWQVLGQRGGKSEQSMYTVPHRSGYRSGQQTPYLLTFIPPLEQYQLYIDKKNENKYNVKGG